MILIPEIPYDIESVAETIERRKKKGRTFSIVAVAEGAISRGDKILSEEERRRQKEANPYSTISYRIADELEKLTGQEARVTVPPATTSGAAPPALMTGCWPPASAPPPPG